MFYFLSGKVALLEANLAVLDCGGVGFAVNTSTATLGKLKPGEPATLYTYCSIREDAFDIYGFASRQELNSFKLLVSVTGVGPKAALAILSSVTPDGLAMAVLTENEKMLTAAQGIGKKIAQRIILELKDKMGAVTEIHTADTAVAVSQPAANQTAAEAVQALQALGYDQSFIQGALKGLQTDSMSVQEIIKAALKKAVQQ